LKSNLPTTQRPSTSDPDITNGSLVRIMTVKYAASSSGIPRLHATIIMVIETQHREGLKAPKKKSQ
jgi:hypothetical protein